MSCNPTPWAIWWRLLAISPDNCTTMVASLGKGKFRGSVCWGLGDEGVVEIVLLVVVVLVVIVVLFTWGWVEERTFSVGELVDEGLSRVDCSLTVVATRNCSDCPNSWSSQRMLNKTRKPNRKLWTHVLERRMPHNYLTIIIVDLEGEQGFVRFDRSWCQQRLFVKRETCWLFVCLYAHNRFPTHNSPTM